MISLEERNTRWEEFRQYTEENNMTKYERHLLRDWVRSGHSVYETVESRYLPGPSNPPMDFLEMYRFDRELTADMKGMTPAEKESYLKACMGWQNPMPEEIVMQEARQQAPEAIKDRVRCLERDLLHLWEFVWQEGLGEDAGEFVKARRNETVPFEW